MRLIKALIIATCLGVGLLFVSFFFVKADEEVEVMVEPIMSAEQFIDSIGETARELGQANDLYASVMIAQAVLESNNGTSGLAVEPYFNLFGVKGSYENESVALETLEDDGEGNMKKVIAEFRKYPSYKDSLQDYVDLLINGLSWDENYYEAVYKSNTNSYHDATAYLSGTYATDSKYSEKLNRLIEQYDLKRFDL